jgi:hypothetical protein
VVMNTYTMRVLRNVRMGAIIYETTSFART